MGIPGGEGGYIHFEEAKKMDGCCVGRYDSSRLIFCYGLWRSAAAADKRRIR